MVYTFDFVKGQAKKFVEPELISDLNNGFLVYKDDIFYNKNKADILFQELIDEVVYDKNSYVFIYGKKIKIPRKQTAFGDPGTTYTFSGSTVKAKPWMPVILKIKKDIEEFTGRKFNFCLVNYYKDGNDYIGFHKDDEQDLVGSSWIVSVSFGEQRKFYFRSDNPSLPLKKMNLIHGSLCIMMPPTNDYWKHSVPKESSKIKSKPRINLTFRLIEN